MEVDSYSLVRDSWRYTGFRARSFIPLVLLHIQGNVATDRAMLWVLWTSTSSFTCGFCWTLKLHWKEMIKLKRAHYLESLLSLKHLASAHAVLCILILFGFGLSLSGECFWITFLTPVLLPKHALGAVSQELAVTLWGDLVSCRLGMLSQALCQGSLELLEGSSRLCRVTEWSRSHLWSPQRCLSHLATSPVSQGAGHGSTSLCIK